MDAFLALPICLPGTTVWKGYKGRLYIIKVGTRLSQCGHVKVGTFTHPKLATLTSIILVDNCFVCAGADQGSQRLQSEDGH